MTCHLRVDDSQSPIPHPTTIAWSSGAASVPDAFATTAVTNPIAAGLHTFALHCEATSGNPQVDRATLSTVMLGPA